MSQPFSDDFDISQIAGNASDDIKRTIGDPGDFFRNRFSDDTRSSIFAESIQKRLKVVEISLNRKADEEKKLEGRVVVELDVTEGQYIILFEPKASLLILFVLLDMLNGSANIHGGCSAFLVDM